MGMNRWFNKSFIIKGIFLMELRTAVGPLVSLPAQGARLESAPGSLARRPSGVAYTPRGRAMGEIPVLPSYAQDLPQASLTRAVAAKTSLRAKTAQLSA